MPTKTVKHRLDCKRVFSRYDPTCPRCKELQAGYSPRQGWNAIKNNDLARLAAIRAHDCKRSGCLSICTANDW